MATQQVSLEDEIELALANAKRLRRDAGAVVVDLARIRDSYQQHVQSEEDTTNHGNSTN